MNRHPRRPGSWEMERLVQALAIPLVVVLTGVAVAMLTSIPVRNAVPASSKRTLTAAGSVSALHSVACLSTSWCMAVGVQSSPARPDDQRALAQRWNGTNWAGSNPPSPGSETVLSSVACFSARSCVAVGSFATAGDPASERALVERWDGSGWIVADTPRLAAPSSLQGVTCVSDSQCVAVGWLRAGDVAQVLVEWMRAGSWRLDQAASLPGGAGGWLQAVACRSANACVGVGLLATHDAIDGNLTLVEQWNGNRWSAVPSPSPSRKSAELNELAAVSCYSDSVCTAVGFYDAGDVYNSHERGLVERWDGHQWSWVPTAVAQPDDGPLQGVACVSQSRCVAVGSSGRGSADERALTEISAGSSWNRASRVTIPGGLESIACPGPTDCVVVGERMGSSPLGNSYAEWLRI